MLRTKKFINKRSKKKHAKRDTRNKKTSINTKKRRILDKSSNDYALKSSIKQWIRILILNVGINNHKKHRYYFYQELRNI